MMTVRSLTVSATVSPLSVFNEIWPAVGSTEASVPTTCDRPPAAAGAGGACANAVTAQKPRFAHTNTLADLTKSPRHKGVTPSNEVTRNAPAIRTRKRYDGR